MPYRKVLIKNNNYYHIYNRGNNRNDIFFEEKNYVFLLKRIEENFIKIAELNAFCFMPNHYHLIVKILDEEKFPKAMNKIFISYTKAINIAYQRTGHLFEGRYKCKMVPDNNYLLHLSRYIHLNPKRAGLVNNIIDWKYSSYNAFVNKSKYSFISHEVITAQIDDYSKFVEEYQAEQRLYLKEIVF
jgi:REP element-mobilizing transposase RayT